MRTRIGRAASAASLLLALFARAAGAGDSTPKITPENASTVKPAASLLGHKGPVFSLAFSPDSSLLASAGIDKTVRWYLAHQGWWERVLSEAYRTANAMYLGKRETGKGKRKAR